MGDGVSVRSATTSDLDDLVRLHRETVGVAYRDYFPPSAVKPSAELLGDLWRRDLDAAHDVLVAVVVDSGVVIGSAVARPGGELARLHVDPSRWRTGVGRALHDRAVDVLRARGYAEVGLWVIDRNQPARTMYERAGWQLVPDVELVELGVKEVRYRLALAR